ncbi:MAG: NAD(P)(+) transhydrogenase (Re/Si-specific) subunit alpha, partial [Rubrobacter sp.]|nr:NAD(P)(+) transhydrogenase (Re/Si-specific) subunit alpha [Rubrobacter sp.]
MNVGVPREVTEGELRVGLVPETVSKLVGEGFGVLVESGAGREYNPDGHYEEAGARIVGSAEEVYGGSDIIVKVAKPTPGEVGMLREGQVLICFLNGPQEPKLVEELARRGVTVFSNEAIPRTSAAQSMDALSTMGSIAGYKSALIAANTLGKYVPMLSTAAGTTKAANALVLGVAVAGLQAIAIMHRLGANVFAYDIRPETKDQARSLGATFIDSADERRSGEEDGWEVYEPTGWRKLMVFLG